MRSAAFPLLVILLFAALPAEARLSSPDFDLKQLPAQDAYAALTRRLAGHVRVLARMEECLLHHPALARQAIPVLALWQRRNAAAQDELLRRLDAAASAMFPGEDLVARHARVDAVVVRAANGAVSAEAPPASTCHRLIDDLREGRHDVRGAQIPALR